MKEKWRKRVCMKEREHEHEAKERRKKNGGSVTTKATRRDKSPIRQMSVTFTGPLSTPPTDSVRAGSYGRLSRHAIWQVSLRQTRLVIYTHERHPISARRGRSTSILRRLQFAGRLKKWCLLHFQLLERNT